MQVLQTTLLPLPGQPATLSLRLKKPRVIATLPDADGANGLGIHLEPGEVLSTDTFFGSFYSGHWQAFAEIGTLAAVVGFRGRGTVRVYETSGAGAVVLCSYDLHASQMRRHLISFQRVGLNDALSGGATASRLYVEIKASHRSEVHSIDFVTEDAPRRDIALSIGLSTFNDEASQISTLLPAILRLAEAEPAIRAVHLVNHGPAFAEPAVLAVLGSAKLKQLSPAADSAPGGLAQTIDAARADGGGTHQLVLADDIVMDPRMILRALDFLRYARSEVILGAAHLDAQDPTSLYSAGAVIGSNGVFRHEGRGIDLNEAGAKPWDELQAVVDYIPWSFCVLPLDKSRPACLPQRPYLRGDDHRYGQDLNRQGVRNLCWPGLAVWRSTALALPRVATPGAAGGDDLTNRHLPLHHCAAEAPANSGQMHVLQTTLFPQTDLAEALYLRSVPPRRRGGLQPHLTPNGSPAIRLDPGNVLSTDAFFGSFYRAYWQHHTSVRDVSVVVELSGRASVRVYEDSGRGAVLLTEERLQTATPRRFLIDFLPSELGLDPGASEPRPSRLFVEIDAASSTDVHAVDFVSTAAPRRRVTLSIGLCTFNQEAYFEKTLTRVARLADSCADIRAVHVVNQGPAFKSDVIRRLLDNPKIAGIEQRNLGGCGGFTRGLVEELAALEPATHHLMMDDDIVLDERMILTALRFLSYAKDEIALGAGMLDGLRPNIMYEAGAFLRSDNTIHPYCHNVDVSDPGQLWHFNTPVKTDYNAWWFCILPVERSRALALPAPVFIRGDDFEYGQRLARDGVATVTLPGIGVWHEPFYAKPTGWQNYYDLRNRLIFGATYVDKVRQLSLTHVTGLITTAILTHNYMAAELRIKAVRDFLRGPDRLFAADPEAIHKGVMDLARRDAPEKLDASWKSTPVSVARPRPASLRALAKDQLFSMVRTGLLPLQRGGNAILIDAEAHPGTTAGQGYVLTNGMRSYHLRFVPNRWRMWGLMVRTAFLALAYRSGRTAAGAAWSTGIATYRDPKWWVASFGRDGAAAKAKVLLKVAQVPVSGVETGPAEAAPPALSETQPR